MGKFTISRLAGGVFLSVGLCFAVPGIASAAAPTTPSPPVVVVAPTTIAAGGRPVSVSGSGLPPHRAVVISECNSALSQPTVPVGGVPTPVSCSRSLRVHTSGDGSLSARFHVIEGKVGPPTFGIDSAGRPARTDARSYPCAPTAAQGSSGAYCYLLFRWGTSAGKQKVQPLTFAAPAVASSGAPSQATAGTSASPSAGTPSSPAEVAHASATVVKVRPRTELSSGRTVEVIAYGLPHRGVGEIMECSSASPQPTVSIAGVPTPVSCTNPRVRRRIFTANGHLTTSFTVVTGTVGPPARGIDSAGLPAATDAKKFPCPPTAAQAAAGAYCYIALRWGTAGHGRVVRIGFASSTSKTTTTPTTTPPVTAATTSPTAATSAQAPAATASLPFTGASIDQMALTGIILVVVGAGLLLVGEIPRRRRRRPGHETPTMGIR